MKRPELAFYPARTYTGLGVLILPGGGYFDIDFKPEGEEPARWLNERGFDAWVFSYPVVLSEEAKDPSRIARIPALTFKPFEAAKDCITHIRRTCRVQKLGVWGFGAGGHLAAMLATKTMGLDFAILAYAMISMEKELADSFTREYLLGAEHQENVAMVDYFSSEKSVYVDTPPTFLYHTSNDDVVPVQNALDFASAMARFRRPFHMLIHSEGPHGVGLGFGRDKPSWTWELDDWLNQFR
ncbi:alpha/beta-hydrolase [Annulohypoxylon moriforme]|nr:alpha/beta-hydrolase [Annulohypoxylon moriforme]